MNTLVNAITEEDNQTVTEKGMAALNSSMNKNVDLFFKAGAMRGKDVIPAFQAAFDENSEIATKIALWLRDVREGAGERELFRNILKYLEVKSPSMLKRVFPAIPELGRWDDLLVFTTQEFKNRAAELIHFGLQVKNEALCAKWMPRKGPTAAWLARYMGVTPKQWRKALVARTKVVEQLMCAKDWNSIEFGKLPSMAAKRYSKAFQRNAADMYTAYLGRLSEGKDKVNAGAIYPHQVVEKIENYADETLAEAMWKALPNFLGNQSILPMIDTSGSMHMGNVAHVAFGLGMYLAEKSTGPFKDCFLTFSENSSLQKLTGSITSRYRQVNTTGWGGTTNIASAFNTILDMAVRNEVEAKDMPDMLLILSDMQFDQCVDLGTGPKIWEAYNNFFSVERATLPKNPKAMEMIRIKYERSGYNVPKIVFWNIADRGENIPVKFNENGVALVSGWSPSIMRSVLKAENFTPEGIMLETVMQDRYTI